MRETSCKITLSALMMVLFFTLGSAQGFNGFGERCDGKGGSPREHIGGRPSGSPEPHQPARDTRSPERPSPRAGGGYSKPVVPDQRQRPKVDAMKEQTRPKPGVGYSKPLTSGQTPQRKPQAVKPPRDVKPPQQQAAPPDQRRVKPSEAGRPPSLQREQPGQRPQAKPGGSGLPMQGIRPQPSQGHKVGPTPEQVQRFLKLPKTDTKPPRTGLGKVGAAAVGAAAGAIALDHFVGKDKPDHRTQGPSTVHHPGKGTHLQDAHQYDARQIRDSYSQRYRRVFDQTWMAHHPALKSYYWHSRVWPDHPWSYWWRPATWLLLTSWIPWRWRTGVFYDYGNNFYYEDGYVILNGRRLCRADEYYGQAVKIISNIPEVSSDANQWMPLGVFGLKPAAGEASDMILQMAVNKDGIIEGTYYNATSDTAKPIRGIVEKKTQRAVWTFADDQNHSVILETGVYNLTQDQTKVLVHFGKDRTEEWLLVRLQEPQT